MRVPIRQPLHKGRHILYKSQFYCTFVTFSHTFKLSHFYSFTFSHTITPSRFHYFTPLNFQTFIFHSQKMPKVAIHILQKLPKFSKSCNKKMQQQQLHSAFPHLRLSGTKYLYRNGISCSRISNSGSG